MKKSMKKLMGLGLCVAMLTAGCAGTEKATPQEGNTTANTTAADSVAAGGNDSQEAGDAKAERTKLDKPITVTVPFQVGSATDVRARIVMEYAEELLGQTVTIYNAPGAAGMIGMTEMVGKNSRNYELSYCSTSVFTAVPLFNQTVYSLDDIIPLVSTDKEQFGMFACPEKSGISTFADVKDYSGRIKYATGAPGSLGHIMCATSMLLLTIDSDHIVTDGASINLSECMGGSNDLAFAGLGLAKDYVKEGRLVPIYTFNEDDYTGYEGYEMPSLKSLGADFYCESLLFFGARKDTPDEVVQLITECLEEALANEECRQRLIDAGAMEITVLNGTEIKDLAETERETFRTYGADIGLTVVQ